MNRRCCADVVDGEELPGLQVRVTRTDLVRYAGASGDFNPIHWSDRAAHEAGLPDIVAHGMLTMALANRLVTAWAGDPGAVVECSARFTRPVVVPDDADGTLIEFAGKVAERHDDGTVIIAITARCAMQTVLGRATATVALACPPHGCHPPRHGAISG